MLLTVGKLEPFKAEEARRVGADSFIIKPFEATELLNCCVGETVGQWCWRRMVGGGYRCAV